MTHKRLLLSIVLLGILFISLPTTAQTVAYWRFEEGPLGEVLLHPVSDGAYYESVQDSSGNGNELSVWDEGWAGYSYVDNLGFTTVNGAANLFSARNNGPSPTMCTSSSDAINLISPAAFTVEAMFKLENGGYRTIVGRDSSGTVSGDAELAALYFQALPENAVAIKFCDVSGYWHQAVSSSNAIQTFDGGSNPSGSGTPWYGMAGVSDGTTLSLYLRNITAGGGWQLAAQTNMTASGSGNTALTAGAGDGNDWDAGNWSVGRGLHHGEHVDRAPGFIDEVRISDAALGVSGLLYCQLPGGVDWMGFLDDDLSLSELSIPGTHDSGALYEPLGGTAKCQNLTIAEQLNAGIRFLDIRCRHIDNAFTIHHGQVYQNMNFDDVLNAVIGFLNAHPSECVLMSVKEEYDPSGNTRSFEATFDSYVQKNPGKWYLGGAVPSLSEVKGKIVLLRRFGVASTPKGIAATNWADNTSFWINNAMSQLHVQDYYNVSDTTAKWNAVSAFLNEAPGGNLNVLYVNFTSGYKTVLFFPSITTVSNAINPQIVSFFSSSPKGRFGVIPMDFADAQKATLIAATNFTVPTAFETADINDDLQVNLADLKAFCQEWLSVPSDKKTDLYADDFVDMKDFRVLAKHWNE